MGLMNSYERYIAVLQGQPVDHIPRTPILMQFAAEFMGSDYASFASDYRTLVQANLECAQTFGMDQVSAISDPFRETHAFGGQITYRTDAPPSSTHPLENIKILSTLKQPNPHLAERMLDRIRAIDSYRQLIARQYSILGWVEGPAAEAADLRNSMPFLIDLVEDPLFASDLMDICVDVAIDFAAAQIQAGADTIGIGDAIASQVSPTLYEKLILPKEKKLVHAIKQAGAFVKLHICGDITHLLPGIAELNIDILDVDFMVDMRTVRKHIGTKTAISGNLDPVRCIKEGPVTGIREALKQIYDQVGNPYIVNAGCEIPAGTPPENLRALCEPLPYQP
ncbi:uroporphyrinogen decarboxylase [candidate division KSB1 bacterium]|nr:uroporphyrinogen decarboxylase [candidate division KSB1 bacterium]